MEHVDRNPDVYKMTQDNFNELVGELDDFKDAVRKEMKMVKTLLDEHLFKEIKPKYKKGDHIVSKGRHGSLGVHGIMASATQCYDGRWAYYITHESTNKVELVHEEDIIK